MKNAIYNLSRLVFGVTLLAFFGMGFAVVFTQAYALCVGDSALVKRIADLLKDNSAYVSTVCAFAGYLCYYTKPAKKKSA